MNCREDMNLHDDNSRLEKARESILLMKKKMFRSHDLILQYNNKLKEFDRLKGDLCNAQDEVTKLKRQNNANHLKVAKLESQIADYKKNQQDLENKIANQDIQIASDKCHLEQLVCKLEVLENKHSGIAIEADIKKSSLEGKIKELEQELKKLKKSQAAELHKSEKAVKAQRGKKSLMNQLTETVDIGVNTIEKQLPAVKPSTADKSILTNEFYHIKDNPYPIFCDKCESLTVPSIDKFCKIMTNHPPLLSKMSSSPPLRESLSFVTTNNFDDPVTSLLTNETPEHHTNLLDSVTPEIKNLKQKIMTLERKMKKRKNQMSRESQWGANCCGHSRPTNCYSSTMTNSSPNVQMDLMMEFWNRMMNFTKESLHKPNEDRRARGKVKKIFVKPRMSVTKKSTNVKREKCGSSANWDIESDDGSIIAESTKKWLEKNSPSNILQSSSCDDEKRVKTDEKLSLVSLRRESSRIQKRNLRNREIDEKTSFSTYETTISSDRDDYDSEMTNGSQFPKFRTAKSSMDESSTFFDQSLRKRDRLVEISQNDNIDQIDRSSHDIDDFGEENQSLCFDDNNRGSLFANSTNSRKRKRENSPKCLKQSVKSKLLGKLRALKKNSVATVTRGSIESIKINDESEIESNEMTTKETIFETAAKKQRVAHVPKKSLIKDNNTFHETSGIHEELSSTRELSKVNERITDTRNEISVNFCDDWESMKNLPNSDVRSSSIKNSDDRSKSLGLPEVGDFRKKEESEDRDIEEDLSKNCSIEIEHRATLEKSIEATGSKTDKSDFPTSASKLPASLHELGNILVQTKSSRIDHKIVTKHNANNCNEQNEPSRIDENAKNSNISGSCFDYSPASPDNSPNSSISHTDLGISSTSNFNDRALIYENVFPVNSTEEMDSQDVSLLSYIDNKNEDERSLQNIVKDLRTRRVLCSPESTIAKIHNQEKIQTPLKTEVGDNFDSIDATAYQRGIRTLGTLLGRHLTGAKKKDNATTKMRKAGALKIQKEAEKSVRSELDNLVEGEEWTSAIHADVITKLYQVSSRRTIAKHIVELLVERATIGEPLDRTYTPPAPVMTRTQQRIVALISSLERDPSMSGISDIVRIGIEFNLFKLGYTVENDVIDALARMLTVLARMKKDRESARILCCDALYFLGRKASHVIHVVLSIWPEVFPSHNSHLDGLVNCMVHLIRNLQYSKALCVKRLLKDYYKYPESQSQSTVLMEGLLNALAKEYTGELEVSILLIAKQEGTEWAFKNIVNRRLLKIIDDDNYPSALNALSLLGFIMRTFPIDDEDNALSSIVEKLCTMLGNVKDSPDREEGIISALLSLSRFYTHFNKIADTILTWKPSRAMRTTTIEQLNTFFKLRSFDWWIKRKRDKPKL